MIFSEFILVIKDKGNGTVRIVIYAMRQSGRHCLLNDRIRFKDKFRILNFDKQVLSLSASIGASNHNANFVYRRIFRRKPLPDARLYRQLPEILLLTWLPFAFGNIFIPLCLHKHPLRFHYTDMSIHVLCVVVERRLAVGAIVQNAGLICIGQFRNREKTCCRWINQFISGKLCNCNIRSFERGCGNLEPSLAAFTGLVFSNSNRYHIRTAASCLVNGKPIATLSNCHSPLFSICVNCYCL